MKSPKRTKTAIIQAATILFSMNGKNGTSVSQIAEYCEINNSLIYYHFDDKDRLYDLVIRVNIKKMINYLHYQILLQHVKAPDRSKLIEIFIRFWQENPEVLKLLIYEINNGADALIEILKSPRTSNLQSKLHNIVAILEQHVSPGADCDDDKINGFISFVGIVMIYALFEPLFDNLFNVSMEQKNDFINRRIELITEVYQSHNRIYNK